MSNLDFYTSNQNFWFESNIFGQIKLNGIFFSTFAVFVAESSHLTCMGGVFLVKPDFLFSQDSICLYQRRVFS